MAVGRRKPGDKPHSLRPEIEESWRRCAACGLDRGKPAPAYAPDDGSGESLRSVAGPVLDRLGEMFEGTKISLYLADTRAVMLDRRCPDRAFARRLDGRMASPGFIWSEELTGTTGLGTALETRRFTWVAGEEHYIDSYAWAVDVGAPILHPITHRMYGAIGLTCPNDVDFRHLNVVLRQAVGNVTDRLYEGSSDRERLLLRRFLEATRHGSPEQGVLLLSERMMVSNPAAARALQGIDNEILWEQAVDAVCARPEVSSEVRLTGEEAVSATFERIDDGTVMAGVLTRLKLPEASRSRSAALRSASSRSVRASYAGQQLDREIEACAAQRHPLLVLGEPGTGKRHTAERIHAAAAAETQMHIVDVALAPVRGDHELLRELASQLDRPRGTVLIRHIECFDHRSMPTLTSLVRRSADAGPRVIATADTQAVDASWAALFPLRIEVPRLRDRIEELPAIIRTLIQRGGGSGRMLPAAIQALSRNDWEGNISELESVVNAALVGRRTCDLTVRDLPAAYRDARGRRRLTRMEQVERATIVSALAEAKGNRTLAAAIVGIGRATLYRKMQAYGIDLETTLI
jgi:transcriptional regulator of acetoin/glycerol metabolism